MAEGILKWLSDGKGFGFIEQEEGISRNIR